jgi:hypothetical protein
MKLLLVMPVEEEVRSRADEIERAIKDRIMQRTGRRIRALEVEVMGDRVMVRGRTTTYHLKQLALQGLLEVTEAVCSTRVEHTIQVEDDQPNTDAERV